MVLLHAICDLAPASLFDIISALSKADLNDYFFVGHSSEYWKDKVSLSMEILANINSIEVLGYDSMAETKRYFPELYEAHKEMVE